MGVDQSFVFQSNEVQSIALKVRGGLICSGSDRQNYSNSKAEVPSAMHQGVAPSPPHPTLLTLQCISLPQRPGKTIPRGPEGSFQTHLHYPYNMHAHTRTHARTHTHTHTHTQGSKHVNTQQWRALPTLSEETLCM